MNAVMLWWHCLIKTFANIKGEDHRMCKATYWPSPGDEDGEIVVERFCSCGYLR